MSSTVSFCKPASPNAVDVSFDSSRPQKSELCQHISNLLTKIFQASTPLWPSCASSGKKRFDSEMSPFRSNNESSCVFAFLDDRSLLALACVARCFPSLVDKWYETQCSKKGILPESLPNKVNCKQLLTDRFPNAISRDTFQEYLGEIEMVPFPRSLIEMAPKTDFQAVFIPEYIMLNLSEKSPLMLDETTADNNGNMARLIEDFERAPNETRTLRVPVTLNNMILLFQKYLKKRPSSHFQFAGITDMSWSHLLAQNGNKGVGPSHWSYQKKGAIGFGKYFSAQTEMANVQGLEITPLCERILFHLLSHIKTGELPKQEESERTSTVTFNSQNIGWSSTLFWPKASGSLFLLDLYGYHDSETPHVGAVVKARL